MGCGLRLKSGLVEKFAVKATNQWSGRQNLEVETDEKCREGDETWAYCTF